MEFSAELKRLPEMMEFIQNSAFKAGVTEDKIYKMELASEEALVNIISYAYPEIDKKFLIIECQKSGNSRFEIIIRDKGVAFNPIEADIDVNLNQSIEDRKIGGLGIFMIRKLVDEVSYQRVGEENILKIVTFLT